MPHDPNLNCSQFSEIKTWVMTLSRTLTITLTLTDAASISQMMTLILTVAVITVTPCLPINLPQGREPTVMITMAGVTLPDYHMTMSH